MIGVYSVKGYGPQINITAGYEIQLHLRKTKSTISNKNRFNNNLKFYPNVEEQPHVNTPYTRQVYNKVLLNSKTSHNKTNMRNTKSNSTKPLARSSPRDDNPRARHSPIDDLPKTEGGVSSDNNETGTALTEDAEVPMLSEAQQNFCNNAIAHTRR